MQEWLNWPLSKSGEPQGSEGSNPSLSAKLKSDPRSVFNLGKKEPPENRGLDPGVVVVRKVLQLAKQPFEPLEKVRQAARRANTSDGVGDCDIAIFLLLSVGATHWRRDQLAVPHAVGAQRFAKKFFGERHIKLGRIVLFVDPGLAKERCELADGFLSDGFLQHIELAVPPVLVADRGDSAFDLRLVFRDLESQLEVTLPGNPRDREFVHSQADEPITEVYRGQVPVVDDMPAVATAFVQHDSAVLVTGDLAALCHHERRVLGRHLESEDVVPEQDEQESDERGNDSGRLDVLVGVRKAVASLAYHVGDLESENLCPDNRRDTGSCYQGNAWVRCYRLDHVDHLLRS
jgi:hypothetical protein